MNTTLTIQEKLKDLRVEHGLTLEQLADQTGLSKSALGKYENDDYKDISPFAIVTLAVLSCDYGLSVRGVRTKKSLRHRAECPAPE